MLARALARGGDREHARFIDARHGNDLDHARRAFGQRARLVEHDLAHGSELLKRARGAEQDAHLRRAARRDHHRDRRREAERARTRDDQHAYQRLDRLGHANVRGREHQPRARRRDRDRDHHRHEHRRHAIGHARDARLRRLRLVDHLDDACQHGVARGARRVDLERAERVHRARDDRVARALDARHRLAREHRLVDLALARDHATIDGHALARPHAHAHAGLDFLGGDLAFAAVHAWIDHPHPRNRQRRKRAQRIARAARGPRLEHAPKQHEHDDDRRRLEPHGGHRFHPMLAMHRRAARDQRPHARRKRHARAKRDERVHVRAKRPRAHKRRAMDRPTAPREHRQRERALHPRARLARDSGNRPMRHRDRHQRQRQRAADHHAHAQRAFLRKFARGAHRRIAIKRQRESRALHARGDLHDVRRLRIEVNAHLARRERHARRANARDAARGRLDLRRARRAVHALDGHDAFSHRSCQRAIRGAA